MQGERIIAYQRLATIAMLWRVSPDRATHANGGLQVARSGDTRHNEGSQRIDYQFKTRSPLGQMTIPSFGNSIQ